MIVRTYGRRSRGTTGRAFSETPPSSLNDDVYDPFAFKEDDNDQQQLPSSSSSYYNNNSSFSQETLEFRNNSQETFNFTFSSQDSTRFLDSAENDTNLGSPLQLLKPRRREKARKLNDGRRETAKTTSLMETQECGEMMECVDEVEFALDGLRKGQKGVKVRRASLLALLNVCSSSQQRRLLKAQGMAKTIIDAILDLSLDDSPSNLAAATLFYTLANDSQDSYLVDSTPSIRFLLKLLKPVVPETVANKAPSISQKLLGLRKDMLIPHDIPGKIDTSSTAIAEKVLESLVSFKDLKASIAEKGNMSRPELNSNWVSLLTMEKACLSTISIEDTTGTVRKTGGNFKDKLRELGGLDEVFELAVKFHSTLEGLTEHVARASSVSKDGKAECLPLLLKCLKIMENATFLSKENQRHLLRLKGNVAGLGSLSFVKLMVNFIKILSELSLLRISSATSSPEAPAVHSNGAVHCPAADFSSKQADCGVFSPHFSKECASMARYSSQTSLSTSQSSQRSFTSESRSLPQSSGPTARSWLGKSLIEISSSVGSGSCSLTSSSYNSGLHTNGNGSNAIIDLSKGPYDNDNIDDMVIDLDDSQDPFAFDEDDYAPSKWDNLPGGKKGRRKQKRRPLLSDVDDMTLSHLILSQADCSSQQISSQENYQTLHPMPNEDGLHNDQQNGSSHLLSDNSCTTIDKENCNLMADCLMTVIKVLMNLTNDNSLGCQQIAACGGLETLSFLIARHFPAFSLSSSGQRKENMPLPNISGLGSEKDGHFSDQELDFLVSILGLLVNLVENDGDNRSRLAAAKISFVCSGELTEVQTGVIPLLCSIFLSNSGAGEAAEEVQSCDDDDDDDEAVLQGEKEAEKMIVEAYAALLLAFLSTESKNTRNAIANYLPDRNLKALVPVLDRFVTFHLTLNMISPETHKTVSEVIESCRVP
ncbi:wings apart-like protein 2 [Silene latifolia]|uniref:wings apart-like protein 2 n=1 Tax=Silene latifolia TaxID=37657 RepID=UPI003D76DDC7